MRLYGFEFKSVNGHIVIYKDGKFYGNAMSIDEAIRDLKEDGDLDD